MMREGNFRISRKEKAFILLSFAFIFLLLFIPLWQLGASRSLEMRINHSEMLLSEVNDEERRVRLLAQERDNEFEREVVLSQRETNSNTYLSAVEI